MLAGAGVIFARLDRVQRQPDVPLIEVDEGGIGGFLEINVAKGLVKKDSVAAAQNRFGILERLPGNADARLKIRSIGILQRAVACDVLPRLIVLLRTSLRRAGLRVNLILAGDGILAGVKAPQGCGFGSCHHQIPIAEVEVGKVVVLFRHQALILVTQTEVQGQMGAHAPIILDEEIVFAERPGDVLLKSVQPVLGKAQQGVGNAVP